MTTIPVEEITAQAREVKFSRILLTLVLGFFWVTGWAAGQFWLGAVMCAFAVRRGWRDGTGHISPPQQVRQPGQVLHSPVKSAG